MTDLIHQLRTERADLLATAAQREATGQPGTARLYRATAALTQYHLDELAPRILPRDMDETLAERMFAARTCRWVDYETDHPARFGVILSQYVKRLSAHAERRALA